MVTKATSKNNLNEEPNHKKYSTPVIIKKNKTPKVKNNKLPFTKSLV